MFAVKSEVLRELLKDQVWTRKLESAKSMCEVERVLREFCRENGWKVKELSFEKLREAGKIEGCNIR